MNEDKDVVLVTGFQPFGVHKINASWEAVKLLPKYKIDNVQIVVEEVPVLYKYVEENIPLLWKKYNPKLVIHVGVSQYADKIVIESKACSKGYYKADCNEQVYNTEDSCTINESTDIITGNIDFEKICDHVNNITELDACVSTDAGRYLCEFTYYKSLEVDRNRTMFVHVPCLHKPYTAEQIAEGLKEIIKCALTQECVQCK